MGKLVASGRLFRTWYLGRGSAHAQPTCIFAHFVTDRSPVGPPTDRDVAIVGAIKYVFEKLNPASGCSRKMYVL